MNIETTTEGWVINGIEVTRVEVMERVHHPIHGVDGSHSPGTMWKAHPEDFRPAMLGLGDDRYFVPKERPYLDSNGEGVGVYLECVAGRWFGWYV